MTSLALRHRWIVLGAWLVLAVLGALTVNTTISRLTYTYSTPGQPGYDANVHVMQQFGIDGTFEPTLAVLHLPADLNMHTTGWTDAPLRTPSPPPPVPAWSRSPTTPTPATRHWCRPTAARPGPC